MWQAEREVAGHVRRGCPCRSCGIPASGRFRRRREVGRTGWVDGWHRERVEVSKWISVRAQSLQPRLSRRRYEWVLYALQYKTVLRWVQNCVSDSDWLRIVSGSEFTMLVPRQQNIFGHISFWSVVLQGRLVQQSGGDCGRLIQIPVSTVLQGTSVQPDEDT